ncbi:hypothetical protein CCACVL1_13128, partial [Corchorus capsularis]
ASGCGTHSDHPEKMRNVDATRRYQK